MVQKEGDSEKRKKGKEKGSGKEVEQLNNRIYELEEKNADLLSTLKMVQADFENYKKRVERDRKESVEMSNKELIMNLLPILDNFGIALQSYGKSSDEMTDEDSDEGSGLKEFLKGVELIYSQFLDSLKKEGVEQIRSVGEKFDPRFHECLMQGDSEEESGTIIEEFQKGYTLKDKVIRPAKVKVAK